MKKWVNDNTNNSEIVQSKTKLCNLKLFKPFLVYQNTCMYIQEIRMGEVGLMNEYVGYN